MDAGNTDELERLNNASLGAGVWIILGIYIGSLLMACVIALGIRRGFFARWGKEAVVIPDGEQVNQHYIARGSLGFFVMPLTIFATFFSGITLVGVPSEASVFGFFALRWLWAGLGMLFGWTLFAPRLRRLSELRGGYMSAVDVVSDRFRDVELRITVALVQIFAAFLYLVAQFVSIGATLFSLSNEAIPKWAGATALAVVMLIYESIGGMQMVAWTDAIQGLMLLIGFLFMFIIQTTEFGGLPNAVDVMANFTGDTEALAVGKPAIELVAVPTHEQMAQQFAFLVGFVPFVLYGHMQHRVFAAQSEKSLRYALMFMAIIVMIIFTGAVFLGIVGRAYFLENNLPVERAETFGTVMRILLLSQGTAHINYFFASLILASGVAALMSTADSALLSMSCVVSLDIVKAFFARTASPQAIVWVGRAVSVIATIVGVLVATTEPVINDLITIQQQFLLQIMPTMMMSMYYKKARSRALFIASLCGMIVNISCVYGSDDPNIVAFAGFIGLCANLPLTIIGHIVDHPIFTGVHGGDPAQWDRFGKPMPERLIGYKIEGFAPELIHNPWYKVLLLVFTLGFLLGVPWFYSPGSLNILPGGFPDWVVQYFVVFPVCHLAMAYIIGYGWVDNPPQAQEVKDLEVGENEEIELETPKKAPTKDEDEAEAEEDSLGALTEDEEDVQGISDSGGLEEDSLNAGDVEKPVAPEAATPVTTEA